MCSIFESVVFGWVFWLERSHEMLQIFFYYHSGCGRIFNENLCSELGKIVVKWNGVCNWNKLQCINRIPAYDSCFIWLNGITNMIKYSFVFVRMRLISAERIFNENIMDDGLFGIHVSLADLFFVCCFHIHKCLIS